MARQFVRLEQGFLEEEEGVLTLDEVNHALSTGSKPGEFKELIPLVTFHKQVWTYVVI